LVRGSLKKSANDRVLEILSSKIFSRLKKELGEENFMKFAMEKIVGIQGDLILEGLGLS